jgi:hypothetical protein
MSFAAAAPMVTGWDVTSDAVKIGLPLVLGGLITLFTLRVSRTHNERVERRKRVQDALEELARVLTRFQGANSDHYLFKADEYFKRCQQNEKWLKNSLKNIERMTRYDDELREAYSLALVLGQDFSEALTAFYGAHNKCRKAFDEAGKTEADIDRTKQQTDMAYKAVLDRVRAAHSSI